MTRVGVNPELLRWARQRSGIDAAALHARFPRLDEWEREEVRPTLKQLEDYARATMTPIGYFFLPQPLHEETPIPDFRTTSDRPIDRPSPNLLETIYLCQQRQGWYRDYAQSHGLPAAGFIASASVDDPIEHTAERMRDWLDFDLEDRRECPTWVEALRRFIAQADAAGIMVMCSGVVLNNNHRRLDNGEFLGFALVDDLAPLVFVNGADSKSRQMFTLAHELAHLWLGQSALSNADVAEASGLVVERWCNRVAAELLAPLHVVRAELIPDEPLGQAMVRVARRFKVSTLVALRRLFDAGALEREAYWQAYRTELERLRELPKGEGGNFYLSQAARASKRFARALVESTLEGRTLYRDAMRMLGISKVETFNELGRSLKFPI